MSALKEMIVIRSGFDGQIYSSQPLIRCKGCAHFDCEDSFCKRNGIIVPNGNWYCADAAIPIESVEGSSHE